MATEHKETLETVAKPCDDYFSHCNSDWIKSNSIPAGYARWSRFNELADTTLEQIKSLTNHIQNFIHQNKSFIVNDQYRVFVKLDKFNDSSIDILVYCFTSTNEWEVFLETKEILAMEIKSKVENLKLNFAFPSQSIYIEKQ